MLLPVSVTAVRDMEEILVKPLSVIHNVSMANAQPLIRVCVTVDTVAPPVPRLSVVLVVPMEEPVLAQMFAGVRMVIPVHYVPYLSAIPLV